MKNSRKSWHAADKSQEQEVIDEARKKRTKVHFASSLMDIYHLKNSELERSVNWGNYGHDS